MPKGKLIVIEGTEQSGKETQSKMLIDRLNNEGYSSAMISFPCYFTPTGENPQVASMYYAADRLDAKPELEKLLGENDFVIADRYVESNMGHQCGKLENPEERSALRNWINNLEYGLNEMPKPDAIIFLYMPFVVSRKLKTEMNEKPDAHESDEEHLRNAEKSYLELSESYGWHRINCSFDGKTARTIKDIHEDIFNFIFQL